MSKEINNEVMEIKHMAFAVEDIEQSLEYYKDFLGVSKEIEIQDMPVSRTRVAVFNIGEIEFIKLNFFYILNCSCVYNYFISNFNEGWNLNINSII